MLKVNLSMTKVVVSGAEREVTVSKVDPCSICGKRVMANSVLCVKCSGRCNKQADGFMDSLEELC